MSNGIVPLALAGSATWVALPAATAQRRVPPFFGVPAEPLGDVPVEPLSPQAANPNNPAPTAAPAPAFNKVRRLIRFVMVSPIVLCSCAPVGRLVMPPPRSRAREEPA